MNMLNKKENYKYIWSILQDYFENDEKRKQINFFVPESRIGAYFEVNNDVISNNKTVDNKVPVNPYLRFEGLIIEKSENDKNREIILKESLNNLYFHLFGNVDLMEGLNAYDIILNFIINDVQNGKFGEEVQNYFKYLNKKEKRIIAKYIKKYYEEDSSFNIFLRAFKEVFSDSIVYRDKTKLRNFLLYINSEKTKNNRMKVKVLSSFFIPFEYKVRVMWKYHVGVIGVEETLQIEEMLII